MLNALPVDLVELSGGSYESPAMQGQSADGRTLAREAYFLDFARDVAAVARMPVMTTGGIARRAVAERVLAGGVAMAGIATALAAMPDLPRQWQAGADPVAAMPAVTWKDKTLAGLARLALVRRRIRALGAGRDRGTAYQPLLTLLVDQLHSAWMARRYRAWLAGRARRLAA